MSSEAPNSSPKPDPAAPASSVQCGGEAIKLLNCLAAGGTCAEQMEAFKTCAKKSKLKEFVLLEECPAPTNSPAAAAGKAGK
jgi:hypothetical protein